MELAVSTPPAFAVEVIARYLRSAEMLGQRTAEMHLALASGGHRDFEPEALTGRDIDDLSAEINIRRRSRFPPSNPGSKRFLPDISSTRPGFSPALMRRSRKQPSTNHFHEQQKRESMATITSARSMGRQRLRHSRFRRGADPNRCGGARSFRRSVTSPGMLRSYHYAAYAGLFAFTRIDRTICATRSLGRDLAAMGLGGLSAPATEGGGRASFLPREPAVRGLLLRLHACKALYELSYELNNRPDWVRIPLGRSHALLWVPRSHAADDWSTTDDHCRADRLRSPPLE